MNIINFLLNLKNSADNQWVNSSLVGDPNYPTYNGIEVITSSALQSFASYMNSKNFPFAYDTAVGMFGKDLWGSGTSPQERSSLVGVAYIKSVCGSSRYAIHEEFGGFQYVGYTTHELGHKYLLLFKENFNLKVGASNFETICIFIIV